MAGLGSERAWRIWAGVYLILVVVVALCGSTESEHSQGHHEGHAEGHEGEEEEEPESHPPVTSCKPLGLDESLELNVLADKLIYYGEAIIGTKYIVESQVSSDLFGRLAFAFCQQEQQFQ